MSSIVAYGSGLDRRETDALAPDDVLAPIALEEALRKGFE